jgi:biotin carboxyl carrier protein
MKYLIKVADKCYEVEIEDVNARPVIARVDGQEFRVSPEEEMQPAIREDVEELKPTALPRQTATTGVMTNELSAPLPGTVTEVFVRPGDTIETGQVILVIEAMKMKNSIRSTRAGQIAEVLVDSGQTVAHKQPLVRFG